MDDNTANSLDKILEKLSSVEAELGRVRRRLDALEAGSETPLESPDLPVDAVRPVVELDKKQQTPASPPPLKSAAKPAAPGVASKPTSPPRLPPMPVVPPAAAVGPEPDVPPGPVLPQRQSQAPSAVALHRAQAGTEAGKPGESLEMRIAGTWLQRIGVLVLALVLVLFAREQVQGPLGKVIGSYLLSLGLIIAGLFYEKKFPRWAAPVLAGGLAFSYFATYAMGFVEPMRLLDNLGVKLSLLAVNLAIIFGFAQWKKSEFMAGTALVLGFLTTGSVGNDTAALGSCLALSVVAVVFLWRNQWITSTALAAGASYAAFLYVQKAVPGAEARSPSEAFWFYFLVLSLLFVIYVVAGWVAAGILRRHERGDSSSPHGLQSVLLALVQTNLAAYIAAMVWTLYRTEVYWPRAWLYFFPMVAVCGLLALMFHRVRPVQMIYLVAGAVCLSFGLMSAASPVWLPIFLAVQALGMLLAGRNKEHALAWNVVSLFVLIYACGYTLSQGQTALGFYEGRIAAGFEWWVFGAVGALSLAFSVLWEKAAKSPRQSEGIMLLLAFATAAMAAIVWERGAKALPSDWPAVYAGAAVPIGVLVAMQWRVASVISFIIIAAWVSIGVNFSDSAADSLGLWAAGYWLVIGAGFGSGILFEKRGQLPRAQSRLVWSTVYLWGQIYLLSTLMTYVVSDWWLFLVSVVFAGTIAVAWFARSAALGKSACLTLLLAMFGALVIIFGGASHWSQVASVGVLLLAAYPVGMIQWQRRTGDTSPSIMRMAQPVALGIAGIIWVATLSRQPYGVNSVFLAGSWVFISAAFAVAGLFAWVIWVPVMFAVIAAVALWMQVVDGSIPAAGVGFMQATHNAQMIWALLGIAFIIAAERFLSAAPRLTRRGEFNPDSPWPNAQSMRSVAVLFAVGSLLMTVLAIRLNPDLRVFYFTGAMVVAAFVWIVLGFWFREPIYRRSGLMLLCAGLLKGLVYDVLSLKNTVYRQISWTILGVLAIGASFLYNRFRGRVD